MDNQQTRKALARLEVLRRSRDSLEEEIIGVVQMGRSPDFDGKCAMSWEAIGKALGVTRQAAQQRYDRFV